MQEQAVTPLLLEKTHDGDSGRRFEIESPVDEFERGAASLQQVLEVGEEGLQRENPHAVFK